MVLRPSPSSLWKHHLVYALGTHILPTIDVQLRVLACVIFSMLGLVPVKRACHRIMLGLDVKAASITHIPAVILFDEVWGVALNSCWGQRWRVWTIRRSDNSTSYIHYSCFVSHRPKRIGTTTSPTKTMPSTTSLSAPLASAHLKGCRNSQRMDGGSLVRGLNCRRTMWRVIHHQVCNIGGWGMVLQQQVLHVRPHCRLIGRKLIDRSGHRNVLLGRWRRIGWGQRGSVCVVQSAACSCIGSSLVCYIQLSSVMDTPSSNTWNMFLLGLATYPCCPLVCSCTAIRRRAYAPWTKTFSEVDILLGITSQSSNSLARKMPDAIKRWTALVINCIGVNGLSAITCIS
jgi:hypothetical protein